MDDILQNIANTTLKLCVDGWRADSGAWRSGHRRGDPIGKLSLYTACGGISRPIPFPLCWMSAPTINSYSTIRFTWAGVIRALPTMGKYARFVDEFYSGR